MSDESHQHMPLLSEIAPQIEVQKAFASLDLVLRELEDACEQLAELATQLKDQHENAAVRSAKTARLRRAPANQRNHLGCEPDGGNQPPSGDFRRSLNLQE